MQHCVWIEPHMSVWSLIAFAYSTYLMPNILWMCILSIYIEPPYSDNRFNKYICMCLYVYRIIYTRDINRFRLFDVPRYIYSLDKLPVMHREWGFFLSSLSSSSSQYVRNYMNSFWLQVWFLVESAKSLNWEIVYMP